jgi:hypothetical protein
MHDRNTERSRDGNAAMLLEFTGSAANPARNRSMMAKASASVLGRQKETSPPK